MKEKRCAHCKGPLSRWSELYCGKVCSGAARRKKCSIVGRRFGKLVVERDLSGHLERSRCRCRCDCGEICVRNRTSLINGDTTSCGCAPHKIRKGMYLFVDMLGQVVGRFTVVERGERLSSGLISWRCRCACGNEVVISGAELRMKRGRKACVRCGAHAKREAQQKAEFPAGTKIGALTVVRVVSGSPFRLLCLCVCGNETVATAAQLRIRPQRGRMDYGKKSCGCKKAARGPRPSRAKTWEVFGEKLTTRELCELVQIKEGTFGARVRRYGFSVEEALFCGGRLAKRVAPSQGLS